SRGYCTRRNLFFGFRPTQSICRSTAPVICSKAVCTGLLSIVRNADRILLVQAVDKLTVACPCSLSYLKCPLSVGCKLFVVKLCKLCLEYRRAVLFPWECKRVILCIFFSCCKACFCLCDRADRI